MFLLRSSQPLSVLINIQAVMGSAEDEFIGLVRKIQTEASLCQPSESHYDIVLMCILFLFINSQLAVRPSWSCSQNAWLSLAIAGRIYVFCIIDVASSPINFLNFCQSFNVPELQLFLGSIAASQNDAVLVIQRFSRNVGPIEMLYTFAFADIPNVHYTVPSSWNQSVLVDEFECEDSVIMAYAVPARRFEIMSDGFGVWVFWDLPSS